MSTIIAEMGGHLNWRMWSSIYLCFIILLLHY